MGGAVAGCRAVPASHSRRGHVAPACALPFLVVVMCFTCAIPCYTVLYRATPRCLPPAAYASAPANTSTATAALSFHGPRPAAAFCAVSIWPLLAATVVADGATEVAPDEAAPPEPAALEPAALGVPASAVELDSVVVVRGEYSNELEYAVVVSICDDASESTVAELCPPANAYDTEAVSQSELSIWIEDSIVRPKRKRVFCFYWHAAVSIATGSLRAPSSSLPPLYTLWLLHHLPFHRPHTDPVTHRPTLRYAARLTSRQPLRHACDGCAAKRFQPEK
ncbi:LAFE_0C10286g1_1 [Lachancea fermentati]|uniref:LAFE_0C10286g1_1 n=1 Tax=Lachancea fermentati TaxID=4955 RepID=A0A1G4MA24_LACFM|nr:LAFE_0C10286g1_1 [Lachancea fermentati]